MGRAYYNDSDKAACAVLRHLIADGVIAPGDVDERSIKDVQPDDLDGYCQVHLFAGGGLWSVAARLAGWPDDRSLWSASCPCQPYSAAGKGLGADDPRHLWPDVHRLARAKRPPALVGEQVAGKAGYGWLDGVRADLAREGYACRAVDIPACAVDAPHQRNRLYWVAVEHASGDGREQGVAWPAPARHRGVFATANGGSHGADADRNLVDASGERRREGWPEYELRGRRNASSDADGTVLLANRLGDGQQVPAPREQSAVGQPLGPDAPLRDGSWWADAEWIECHDQKARRTQSGSPLLVDGVPGRVDLWRIAGNAISPILAAEVIGAFLDIAPTPEAHHER